MKKARFILPLIIMMMFLFSLDIFAEELLSAEDYYNKGLAFFEQSNYSEAINNYKKAIELDPTYIQAYLDMSDACFYQRKYEEAIANYDAVIELEPANAYAYYSKGVMLYFLFKYDEAIKMYDEAIKIDPDYGDAYQSKGNSLFSLERYSEAMECYDKALKLNPFDADIIEALGDTYYLQELYEKAIEYYDLAIYYNTSNKFVYIYKGCSLYHLSKYDEAIKALELGLEKLPDDAIANYYMSLSLVKTGNTKDYCPYLKKAVSLNKLYLKRAPSEEAFKNLLQDEAFIEIIYDAEEEIHDIFENSDILESDALAEIHFLNMKTSGNAKEDAKALKAERDFLNNFYNGNIYNSASAKKCHISSNSSHITDFIKSGRLIKGQALVGLKITHNISKENILYIGKQDGVLKAVIFEIAGEIKMDDFSLAINDYIIFIYNNGIWEYFGNLEPKEL